MLKLGKGFSVFIFLIFMTGCYKPCSPVSYTNKTCFWQLKVLEDVDQASGRTVARLPGPEELSKSGESQKDRERLEPFATRIREKYGENQASYPKYVFYVSEESRRLIKKDKVYVFTNGHASPLIEVFAEDHGRK